MATTSTSTGRHRSRSIMVVGNKTQQVLSVCLLLRKFGFTVHNVISAAEAVEQMAQAVPDLVITDQVLSDMSGMDLLHLLKKTKRTGSVPVIFMIPMTDAASERHCLESGAADCITKPVLAESLYRVVQEAIEPAPRGDIRIGMKVPVSVNNVPLACSGEGCNIDLSEGGMYVPIDKPYPLNRRITVQFRIKDRAISAESSVLYSYTSSGTTNRMPGMGLKFITMDPGDREFIRKVIREELTRNVSEEASKGAPHAW